MGFETTAEFAAIQTRTHLEFAIDSLNQALRWARTADCTSGFTRYNIVVARDEAQLAIADLDARSPAPNPQSPAPVLFTEENHARSQS